MVGTHLSLFALTTRGLETLCADEMAALPGLAVRAVGYRQVRAGYAGDVRALLTLRTVDDVYVAVAEWAGLATQRGALADLSARARGWPLSAAVDPCRHVRPVADPPGFSVTASFVGQRNYSAPEIKQAVALGIHEALGWRYCADDREAELNVRLFIEHERVLVGVRLGATTLHRRAYKQEQLPGSLKPPVAAAMLRLAQVGAGASVLDPCCGAGTIAIEAAALGCRVWGSDLAPDALPAAVRNGAAAGAAAGAVVHWLHGDAMHLPVVSRSVDAVVSNLPWGRQVSADADLQAMYRAACREMERVVAPGGRIVLLTTWAEWLCFDQMVLEQAIEISLFGQRPIISVMRRSAGR